jgi:hypothetical protein
LKKTYFEVVKEVLDSAYQDVPKKNRDENIVKARTALSEEYKSVLIGHNISYSSAATRFAYVYTYTTAHAVMLAQALADVEDEMKRLFDQKWLEVTCFGGGPGSDILGFLKEAIRRNSTAKLKFHAIDKEKAWAETWGDIDKVLDDDLTVSRDFRDADVTSSSDMANLSKPSRADVLTFIYFLSEIFHLRDEVERNLLTFLSRAKEGALLLAIDFRDQAVRDWIDSIALKAGFSVIEKIDNWSFQLPPSEETNDLGEYKKKFGLPKLKGQNFLRWYKKT